MSSSAAPISTDTTATAHSPTAHGVAVPPGHGPHATAHGHDDEHGYAHVMPPSVLIATFVALIALTLLTVGMSDLPLGGFELYVAMGIATIKAVLVAVYFMHLRYDKPLNSLLAIFSLVFVALFLCLTLADSVAYQGEIKAATPTDP